MRARFSARLANTCGHTHCFQFCMNLENRSWLVLICTQMKKKMRSQEQSSPRRIWHQGGSLSSPKRPLEQRLSSQKKVIMAFPSPHSSRHQNTHVSSPHTSSEQLLSSPNWSSEEPLLTKNGHQSSWVALKYQLRSNNPCKLTRDALIIDLRASCRIIKNQIVYPQRRWDATGFCKPRKVLLLQRMRPARMAY